MSFGESLISSRIIVLGTINIDHFAYVDKFPEIGESVGDASYYKDYGGKGLNIAVALKRLGLEVSLIGCVGDDSYGSEILGFLRSENIDISNIKISRGITGTAFVIVQRDGRKSIISVPGTNYSVSPHDIDQIFASSRKYDLLVVTLGINLESVKKALEISKNRGVKTILIPSPIRKISMDLLENILLLSDFIILNETEFKRIFLDTLRISTSNDLVRAIRSIKLFEDKTIIITRSEYGSVIYDRDKVYEIPSHRRSTLSIIDTTGAGDAFVAGFIYGYLCTGSLEISGILGSLNAYLKISRRGSSSAMPYINELVNALKSFNMRNILGTLHQKRCL